MAARKTRAKTTERADRPVDTSSVPPTASTGGPRSTARMGEGEQQVAYDDGSGPEPSEINSSLDSDRMKALLADHRAMGSRP